MEKLNRKLSALLNEKRIRFLNVDLARLSGTIYIRAENRAYPNILSRIADIDTLLGDELEADILDTHIHVTYQGDNQELFVKITFDYD